MAVGKGHKGAKPLACSVGGVGGLHSLVVSGMILFMEYRGIASVIVFGLVMEVSSVFLGMRALDLSAVSRRANAVLDGLFTHFCGDTSWTCAV